jgi:galactose-1-phosphate uridylyltransferase
MYLTLTEQNEYKNPHTGNTERDTDHWKYRWVNNIGEIVYSDYQNYDPNHDIELNKRGFKLSTPRK